MLANGLLSRTSPSRARSHGYLSRRACLAFLAGSASAALDWNIVRAQEDVWREFRLDDAGFRIEMPGVPAVDEDQPLASDPWRRMISAEIEYEQIFFGLTYVEYRQSRSEDEVFRGFARLVSNTFKIVAETPLTMNGFRGGEIIVVDTDLDVSYVYRSFALNNNAFILLTAGGLVANPNVRRFLDSLMLLRS
jgi:hypothetical protein